MNFSVTWAICLFEPPHCSKHCYLPCCCHTFTITSVELTKSISDIDTQYFLTLTDLNSNSSVFLCKIAQIYDLPQSTLQAWWKEMSQVCNETDTQLIISKYKKNTMKRKRRASYRSEKIMCFSLRVLVSN